MKTNRALLNHRSSLEATFVQESTTKIAKRNMKYMFFFIMLIFSSCNIENSESIDLESSSVNTEATEKRGSKPEAFKEITIGSQVWMAENLNVDKFRNGDPIQEARSADEWKKAGENYQPAWCYYINDHNFGGRYGKLYNWFAVNDPRGLAPKGWKIPSHSDWYQLTDYLGGEDIAGYNLIGLST